MTIETQVKDAISKKEVVIGSSQVAKHLKSSKLKTIIVSNNCPDEIKNTNEHLSKIAGTTIENFDGTDKELGIICGKPFSIAVLGIKK
jgi:large subunit ribosomal protein L30e